MLGWMVLTSICITTTNEMTSWIKTKPEIIALFLTNSTDGWICNYSIPFIVLNESCCFGDMRTAVRHVVNKKCRGFLLIPKIFRKCVKACLRFFFYSKKIQIEERHYVTPLVIYFDFCDTPKRRYQIEFGDKGHDMLKFYVTYPTILEFYYCN